MATQHRRTEVVEKALRALIHRYQHHLPHRHLADKMPQVATFAFDSMGLAINLFGRLDREELDVLIGWLATQGKIAGACVDVGANIGNHALFFAGHYSQVFAFEPVPRTFRLLEMNAALAGNIRCFNLGLSNESADAWIIEPTSNSGAAKILSEDEVAGGRPAAQTRIVSLDTLDEVCRNRIGLMKIDVEGHELQVLQGAESLIARDRPVVLLEQRHRDFSGGTTSCLEFLKAAGYRRFATTEKTPSLGNSYLTVIARLIFGERIEMVDIARFEPKFYAMIVAIP